MSVLVRDGVHLHYELRGEGPPLLLLMGLGAGSDRWEAHVSAYARHFRCILLDNRGAGASDTPPVAYSTREMAEDAAAVLDALGIGSTAVAGISMGGAIAQELALAQPERISRLLLVSTWARCDAYLHGVFAHFSQMRAICTPEQFALLLQLWIFAPAYVERQQQDLAQARRAAVIDYMPLDSFAAQCAACSGHDSTSRLAGLGVPTLLTVGEQDIFTPPRCTDELARLLPARQVLSFPGCGHAHHWEDLERFNSQSCAFLRSGTLAP